MLSNLLGVLAGADQRLLELALVGGVLGFLAVNQGAKLAAAGRRRAAARRQQRRQAVEDRASAGDRQRRPARGAADGSTGGEGRAAAGTAANGAVANGAAVAAVQVADQEGLQREGGPGQSLPLRRSGSTVDSSASSSNGGGSTGREGGHSVPLRRSGSTADPSASSSSGGGIGGIGSCGSGGSEGSEDGGAAYGGGAWSQQLLSNEEIDTAAWRCFVEGDQDAALWSQRASEAMAAVDAAQAAGAPPDGVCCRAMPPNLRSIRTEGGLEVLVPDWWMQGKFTAEEEERLHSLQQLLARLGRRVFLRDLWDCKIRLYWDPSDPASAFMDATGAPHFNFARDPPLPAPPSPDGAGSSRQAGGSHDRHAGNHCDHRARRALYWYLACCHLVAHWWGGCHDGAAARRCGQVALRCHNRYRQAFFRRGKRQQGQGREE